LAGCHYVKPSLACTALIIGWLSLVSALLGSQLAINWLAVIISSPPWLHRANYWLAVISFCSPQLSSNPRLYLPQGNVRRAACGTPVH